MFFDPEYTDEPPERGQDALKAMELSEETKQKAEESLRNLLELGGDEDDELLLDIDTQLTEKQLQKMPMISGKYTPRKLHYTKKTRFLILRLFN